MTHLPKLQLQKLQHFLTPWLAQQPAVEAAIVFGSALTVWPAADGDIDLLLICDQPGRQKQLQVFKGVQLDLTFVDISTLRHWLSAPAQKRQWLEILARAALLWRRDGAVADDGQVGTLLAAARTEWQAPYRPTPAAVALAYRSALRCLRKMAAASEMDWTYRHFSQSLLEYLYVLLCYRAGVWPFDFVVDRQRHLHEQFAAFADRWQQSWLLSDLALQREALTELAQQVLQDVEFNRSRDVTGLTVAGVSDAELA